MISERHFSSSHSSFWKQLAPWGERTVRAINMGLCERFAEPIRASVSSDYRGYVNELAFRVAESSFLSARTPGGVKIKKNVRDKALMKWRALSGGRVSNLEPPRNECDQEALLIANALIAYLREYPGNVDISFSPRFQGCGVLDACEGDVFAGEALIEVKAGERKFSITDIRQLLCYCTLARAAGTRISHVALVNPRTGLAFYSSLDELADSLSGVPASELLDQIIEYVSKEDEQK